MLRQTEEGVHMTEPEAQEIVDAVVKAGWRILEERRRAEDDQKEASWLADSLLSNIVRRYQPLSDADLMQTALMEVGKDSVYRTRC